MKPGAIIRFRTRLIVLLTIGVIIIGILVKKKVVPAWDTWQESRMVNREFASGNDPVNTLQKARAHLRELEQRIGGDGSVYGWRPVLDLLESEGAAQRVTLATVEGEHNLEDNGLRISTLPIALKGRTVDIVNAIAALEQSTTGVHLIGIDLEARETGYHGPRTLTATLYLQTIQQP